MSAAAVEARNTGRIKGAGTRLPGLVGLLPFFFFVIVLSILSPLDIKMALNAPLLIAVLNTLFMCASGLIITYVVSRSFVENGSLGFVLLGSGIFTFSIAGMVSGWLIGPAGTNVAAIIHNIGALSASVLHIFGTILLLRGTTIRHTVLTRIITLAVVYVAIAGFVALLTVGSLREIMPTFFIPAVGSTLVRAQVLASATSMFFVSGVLLFVLHRRSGSSFLYWYSVGLLLIATGLLAISFAKTGFGPFSWTGRSAQYTGGTYLLVAVLISWREAHGKKTSLQQSIALFLHESEENYRLLLETTNDAIMFVDSEGRVLLCNNAAEQILGYTRDEMVGSLVTDLAVLSQQADFIKERLENLAMGYPGTTYAEIIELQGTKKDGEIVPIELSISGRKTPVQSVSRFVLRDISERKQAEERLKSLYEEVRALNVELEQRVTERTNQLEIALKEAETASRAKSDFLASMSHELRTPLNSVIGFSQMLREQYFGELNEKQAEYVSNILESGKHLLSLINDILDLSKIEAGKMELELSSVKIKDLLGNSLVMIKEKALAHRMSLNLNITANLENLEIMVDERRIKQAMFNLLSNAAKFTPDGGAITVEARREGKELIVSVSDTGIGIAPEEQERIFKKFYQVSGNITDKTSGTGLGLSLTKSIVEMHGGRIWVESEGIGKGSRFTFTLPI